MLNKTYPAHDINEVFNWMEEVLKVGDCANNAMDELKFVNSLFAALPATAVEYGMQFLNGNRDLPKACDEIMPLYIRFVNLASYCEDIEFLRNVPANPSTEDIMKRMEVNKELDDLEKPFGKPLLGFKFNETPKEQIDTANIKTEDSSADEKKEGTSDLHLMNAQAPIFVCDDPDKTALFYANSCGFSTYYLDDESMPHIRISRDNIDIVLIASKTGTKALPNREAFGIPYDMYIYVSEPKMLELELIGKNVKIIKALPDASETSNVNREFVFEDIDGRHICVSQRDVM